MTPEGVADKLERQPLHERGVYISWQTRDEIVDLLRRPNAAEAERDAAEADAERGWRWVDLMDTDKDEAEIYGELDRDRDAHRARIKGDR